jgi:hypothetical protein
MLASEIMRELDEADRRNKFPSLLTYYPIDVRLSAYRRDQHWALIIETFVSNQGCLRHESPLTYIYCFGNSLLGKPRLFYSELKVTKDGPSGPLFDLSEYDNLISPSATDMTIRDKVVPITTNPAAYVVAGIELRDATRVRCHELLRLIAPRNRRLFFATESEIIERIGESMPLLLRLDEWRHPEINEEPYQCESFQMIAEAIAHNDPSLYQPTELPNTHWSNWPMAGTI